MAESKGTPTTPKEEKEAQQSKPWTLKEWWGKPVWEWMQLSLQLVGVLAIPLVIAIVGLSFNAELDSRQRDAEEQRAQDLALQGYLDTMSTLVLKDLSDTRVQAVMRARTLTALERLNPSRKAEVMQFLVEADLASGPGETQPVVSLNEADLHDTDLPPNSDLTGAKLKQANLHGAELPGSFLADASLVYADLSDTNMYGAHLQDTDLSYADLSGAGLENADLRDSNLLVTDLNDADLEGANLKGADGWEAQQLTLAMSLEGATMPNGQKYEDWIKDRESRKQNE